MSSLSSALSISIGALQSEQGALDVTTNNVANVNTPGYAREAPNLIENPPIVLGPLTYGSGVSLQSIQSLRDPILQARIAQETQEQGQLNSFVAAMQQAQTLFTSSTGDLGTAISNFFTSVDQLSTNPSDVSLRQGLLTAAGDMAKAFNNTANNLIQQQSNLNLNVVEDVQQVNTLTAQIAQLNAQITNLTNIHHDASAFIDQRDVLIGKLSNLIDVQQIQSDNTLTLTTSNGTALVAGSQSFTLTTQPNASGQQQVFAQGVNITGNLTSGSLAGTLQARDQTLPGVLNQLDTLAAGLANGLNAAQASGYDLNGNPGGNLFVPPPASGQGAAASMKVAITGPSLIAASSDGSPDSNGNLAAFSAVATQPIAQLAAPNLNEQDSPAPGALNLNEVLTVGAQTSVTAGGITFTYTNGPTSGANLNEATGANAVTAATPLAAGDVITATRAGQTTIYTATAATTVGNLITAINRGFTGAVPGTNISISGSDTQHTGYQAVLAGGKLQIVDLNSNNDLGVTQSSGAELGAFTSNTAATSTLQDLINAINSDTTVGAHAALVGGKLEISDPQNRGDLTVTTTDPILGSGGAAAAFTTPNLSTGQSPTDYYSNVVFGVGNDVSNSSAELSASQLILQQLQDQRGSISGVSLDEEAANMVNYERAYDAAARIVTAVDNMLGTVINMGS